MTYRLLPLTLLCAFVVVGASAVSFAADVFVPPGASDPFVAPSSLPAVSAVNGKIGVFAGGISGDAAGGAFGALSMPLAGQWGAQIDVLGGAASGQGIFGVGGHLFWRDPARGLIGAYASYVDWNTFSTVGKVGVEAEAYLGRMSLEGLLAYQYGTDTGVAGKATVAYYPLDDLRLELGFRHLQGVGSLGAVGVEWAPTSSHMTLFADGGFGSGSYWYAHGGVKVYFGGQDKPLIRRHREDDPDVDVHKDLYNPCPVVVQAAQAQVVEAAAVQQRCLAEVD